MATIEKITITVEATINAPVEKVWDCWTDAKHIIKWNAASEDWHTPHAENDLRVGGKFLSRMESKDGSMGFDFSGNYLVVDTYTQLEYVIEDGRKVNIRFTAVGNTTTVTEIFEAESTNSHELQKTGWQSILNAFKKYVEKSGTMEKLHFDISINAPVNEVYKIMLEEQTYNEWAAEFDPTSHFKGSWDKGSKILFIGTDQEGNKMGMVSRIKENIPNKLVSIEHIGILKGNEEMTSGPTVEGWLGALEDYTFRDDIGKTLLSVDMDVKDEYKSYFEAAWPRALNKLKQICER